MLARLCLTWAPAARIFDKRPKLTSHHACQCQEFFIFLIILQNYITISKFYGFDNHSPWATAVRPIVMAPHGCGGQPLWVTAVEDSSSCATAARPNVVAHDGKAHAAAVAYSGRFAALYIRRKLVRKCHKISEKRKRGLGRRRE
jgi:hypothetical protein